MESGGIRWNPEAFDNAAVQHPRASARDCTHGQLVMPGNAKLANDQNIQRQLEHLRHLVADWNPASGECQHKGIGEVRVFHQLGRKHAPGVSPVLESCCHWMFVSWLVFFGGIITLRWCWNHPAARFAAFSSAPGSSKRWVAPGITAIFFGQRRHW